jgi:hypothetical protein
VRPSRQRILDGEKEAKVIAICCGAKPAGHARWTLRLLAERLVELEIVESISHGEEKVSGKAPVKAGRE